MKYFEGLAACRGIAIGTAVVLVKEKVDIPKYSIDEVTTELSRFHECRNTVGSDLETLGKKITEKAGIENGEILEIQREFLEDPDYGEAIVDFIRANRTNAEFAVTEVSRTLVSEFKEINDEYFSQRAIDIQDLSDRLVRNLLGLSRDVNLNSNGPQIIIAHDLSPSDTASLDLDRTLALCIEVGGKTSHTAILSRSLNIPSLVGLGKVEVQNGDLVIVDAVESNLIVKPDNNILEEYQRKQEKFNSRRKLLIKDAGKPAISIDGFEYLIASNVASFDDAIFAKEQGAEGIGLLRTEFLFLERSDLPGEEEQYLKYREIVDVFPDSPVVIRTLDVGGDKSLPAISIEHEANPFLGMRALRLAFSDPQNLLTPQLKAVLRAGVDRNIKLLFPMVGGLEEIHKAKKYLSQARNELKSSQSAFTNNVEIGVMIEIPSAAILVEKLAEHVDYFSIGTNDLTQYTLAVDRTNETISYLADYFHPAVISLISTVIFGAHKHGKKVEMCGEMAGDPLAVPLLIGLGLDVFSMAASVIPEIKYQIRELEKSHCKDLANRVLLASTVEEVRNICMDSRIS